MSFFTAPGKNICVCLALVLVTAAVYAPVGRFDFIALDDDVYVTENPAVKSGLGPAGIAAAFTTAPGGLWIPLTWISLMGDYELYGLDAGGYHITNLILHLCNAILLLLVLVSFTGSFRQSALVAGLFALHPLHVESVAWVTERKDVLSTFFFILTLWSYGRYVRGAGAAGYAAALLLFGCGLMAKPMLVTVPFVLLLLDFWPLGRLRKGWGAVLPDKIPFFVLSAAACAVTLAVQQNIASISSLSAIPFTVRIANAVVSYAAYLGKMLWPLDLSVFYPYPEMLPWWQVTGAGLLLVGISAGVFSLRRRFPFLLAGWLWYLGALVPVIGLAQSGAQAMADRFVYIPLIGIYVMLAWGLSKCLRREMRGLTAAAAVMVLAACMLLTARQVRYWKDSVTLFNQALAVTQRNFVMHNNLGVVYARQGSVSEAAVHFREAVRINPGYYEAHNNLGAALARQGLSEQAAGYYRAALRIDPGFADAHNNLGAVLEQSDRLDEAVSAYEIAVKHDPQHVRALVNLGGVLLKQGRLDEAVRRCESALRLEPTAVDAHYNMGVALARQGRAAAAVGHYNEVLKYDPAYVKAHNNLGVLLYQQGKVAPAVQHFRAALRVKPDYAQARANLEKVLAVYEKDE
ncbi:MAG: tetratricopeptide repeat protein [Deltaproteobacteria bacterium]|nr:tetratricopeptide repeat protein [Deltaproteobacteria bacterium]